MNTVIRAYQEGVIQVAPSPAIPGYYFSNKYLRNLLNGEKGKRNPGQYPF
ncbi:hypothetical protein [Wolbachia endosymbiont of Cimex lectularius]|nr:hypothetical protein [Wolbachia endosymbiont of Cimex lectularius]BAP00007.1 hypothetical protein WCLE_007090 [Wolbachia endosymbiont of Cimex lectularius]